MLVIGAGGGKLLKPFADVLNQAAFVVVDVDGGGDVHGRDEAQAVADAAAVDDLLDLVGDVDHLAALLVSKTRYSVWLFIAPRWGRVGVWRLNHYPKDIMNSANRCRRALPARTRSAG